MCYEKTKNENFGGVTLKKLMSVRSLKTTRRMVKSFCSGINSIESVYFIELTKHDPQKEKTSALCITNSEVVDKKPQKKATICSEEKWFTILLRRKL